MLSKDAHIEQLVKSESLAVSISGVGGGHIGLEVPLIFGLCDFDSGQQCVYICDHSGFSELSKYISIHTANLFGIACPYLYVGDGCRYVWHLQKHADDSLFPLNYSNSKRKKMWLVVQECASSALNSIITDQLKYNLDCTEFIRQLPSVSKNLVSSPQYERFVVRMAVLDPHELLVMCPSEKSVHSSLLLNAVYYVHEVRIDASKIARRPSAGSDFFNEFLTTLSTSGNRASGNAVVLDSQSSWLQAQPTSAASCSSAVIVDEVKPPLNCRSLSQQNHFTEEHDSCFEINENFVKLEVTEQICAETSIKTNIIGISDSSDKGMSETVSSKKLTVSELCKVRGKQITDTKPIRMSCFRNSLLRQCPACGMTYRSSRNRFKALVSHINRRHSAQSAQLLHVITERYRH